MMRERRGDGLKLAGARFVATEVENAIERLSSVWNRSRET